MAQAQTQMGQALQNERKRLLIEATVRAIHTYGLSNLTLAKIAGLAGLTAGTVNFHFASKESLLLATLKYLAEEFDLAIQKALAIAGSDPAMCLRALVDANLQPKLADSRKIAVWYAFMSEASSREDYQRICDDRDSAYYRSVLELCRRIAASQPAKRRSDAEAVAYGLVGLLELIWQEILFSGAEFNGETARRRCAAYLASVFPGVFPMPGEAHNRVSQADETRGLAPVQKDGLSYTLPSWLYHSPGFLELEQEHLFLPSWQVVCHISDLPKAGAYATFEIFGERAFVIRDRDAKIRAFHNVCAHRAHTVVQGSAGRCPGRLTCPYHGWTYGLDGRRIGVGSPESFRTHDPSGFGLKELECEALFGFVFIRFRGGGPGVAECFAPVLEEFGKFRTEEMRWDGYGFDNESFWTEVVDVNWKNALENYVEDYHFPTGHKGLSALMEDEYERQAFPRGLARLSHRFREKPMSNWSVARYHKLLPRYSHLPEQMQRRWTYYALFPNTFFDLFPDHMDFMQVIPLAPGRIMLRGKYYALPDGSRETRASRYLSDRINRRVQSEDNRLTTEVQKGLRSSGYQQGILSDKEVLVKHFQDWVRERLPIAGLIEEPGPGSMAARNRDLREQAFGESP